MDMLTPVSLAFIGDAVHTLYVRERAVEAERPSGTLHTAAAKRVNASAQSRVYDELVARSVFTAEETEIARRAKNAHLHSRAKSASVGDYHKATALEAVIGYVHLKGDVSREKQLLELCYSVNETL